MKYENSFGISFPMAPLEIGAWRIGQPWEMNQSREARKALAIVAIKSQTYV